jgi:hypothetical protein
VIGGLSLLLFLVWVIIAYWQQDNIFKYFLCVAWMCLTNYLSENFEAEGHTDQSGMKLVNHHVVWRPSQQTTVEDDGLKRIHNECTCK